MVSSGAYDPIGDGMAQFLKKALRIEVSSPSWLYVPYKSMLNIFVSIAQIPLIVYTYVSYLYVKNIISGTPAEPENSNHPKNGEIAIQYSV